MRLYRIMALMAVTLTVASAGLLLLEWLQGAWRRRACLEAAVEVVNVSSRRVPLYGLLEVDLNVTASYDNPFDPDQVNVTAVFELPSGKTVGIPAFYYQGYRRRLVEGREVLEPVGDPRWKVRFTPTEIGVHKFYVEVRDGCGGFARSREVRFNVVPSDERGFVRACPHSRYLCFDDGSSTFFVGHNVCWYGPRGTFDYDEWFSEMAASGENVARIWMAPWAFGIEWRELGSYDLAEAWRLDYVLRLAEERGIYVILCLMNHGQLQSGGMTGEWGDNPYNRRNGGPLARPVDFWVSAEAIKLFRRRLRYIVARWGYSTHILAWELWNEVDLTDGYDPEVVVEWHRSTAEYLRELDPYDHLITTSFADPLREPGAWSLNEIDLVTLHKYGPQSFADIAGSIPQLVEERWRNYRKPVIVEEFASDWRWFNEPLYYEDEEGIELHNGAWSAIMAGSPATAMLWWWDSYVHPYGLYGHYKALTAFLKGVDPHNSGLREVRGEPLLPQDLEEHLGSLTVYPSLGWARPRVNVFEVSLMGEVGNESQFSYFIHGRAHPELRNNPAFRAAFPRGGGVVVRVNSVARSGAVLAVYVDENMALEEELPDLDGRNDAFANEYGLKIAVEVPPGIHAIRLDNLGGDWLTIDYLRLEGAVVEQAKARILGLANGTFAIVWIQNRESTWWNAVYGIAVEPIEDLRIALYDLEDGDYIVELWDPYRGVIVAEERLGSLHSGVLALM